MYCCKMLVAIEALCCQLNYITLHLVQLVYLLLCKQVTLVHLVQLVYLVRLVTQVSPVLLVQVVFKVSLVEQVLLVLLDRVVQLDQLDQ